jgi:hypothetical protein
LVPQILNFIKDNGGVLALVIGVASIGAGTAKFITATNDLDELKSKIVKLESESRENERKILFLESRSNLKGEKGERGEQGLQGVAGPQGPMGPQGAKGETTIIYKTDGTNFVGECIQIASTGIYKDYLFGVQSTQTLHAYPRTVMGHRALFKAVSPKGVVFLMDCQKSSTNTIPNITWHSQTPQNQPDE